MQLSLSFGPQRRLAVSKRHIRAGYRRMAFKAFPRLTGFLVL